LDFWLQAVLNAISLAVGVATGSFITFYLTRKQLRSMIDEFSESEMVKNLKAVLESMRGFLESEDSKVFLKRMREILERLLTQSEEEKKELIKIP